MQDRYKSLIVTSANKYDATKDTLLSAIQKVYGVTDTVSENIETKITNYNILFNGQKLPKDNMDISIHKKDSGYLVTLNVKNPKVLPMTPAPDSISPVNIEFDTKGQLITQNIQIA